MGSSSGFKLENAAAEQVLGDVSTSRPGWHQHLSLVTLSSVHMILSLWRDPCSLVMRNHTEQALHSILVAAQDKKPFLRVDIRMAMTSES